MAKQDVVCVLGEYDGPVHIELKAEDVEGEDEGLDRIVEGLGSGCGGNCSLHPHDGDVLLYAELHNGVTITVVLEADRERIEDNARVGVRGRPA